jgi:hypothetical protein
MERRYAFAQHVAALEREERAAGDYRRALEPVNQP